MKNIKLLSVICCVLVLSLGSVFGGLDDYRRLIAMSGNGKSKRIVSFITMMRAEISCRHEIERIFKHLCLEELYNRMGVSDCSDMVRHYVFFKMMHDIIINGSPIPFLEVNRENLSILLLEIEKNSDNENEGVNFLYRFLKSVWMNSFFVDVSGEVLGLLSGFVRQSTIGMRDSDRDRILGGLIPFFGLMGAYLGSKK